MRGKEVQAREGMTVSGITPAYAGKSDRNQNGNAGDKDHPRLCGEKSQIIEDRYPVKGSPPPMRGKAQCRKVGSTVFGITPAYAGKSHPIHSGPMQL